MGDNVKIATAGGTAAYEITGTARFGEVDSLGFGSIAIWDVATAQSVLGREGRYDTISLAASKGTSPAELVRAVQPLLPAALEVKDSAVQAEEASAEVDKGMSFIRYFLLGFGGIALFVGAFVIYNTLSITVAQRTREFATLRTLGASRKQVLRSVRLEGLVLGLLASTIGLFLGFGIAKGMLVLFSALGVDLPKADTVFALRTVLVSLAIGTGITLIATILPARRATRVPPIAAVREGSTLPVSRFAAHTSKAGLGVVLGSVAAISAGVFGGLGGAATGLLLGVGVIVLFLGIALLAPRLVGPLARVVGWPARRAGGVAGELAEAQCAAQSPPHGVHRCGPDDRADARDGGRGAWRRHERLDQERGQRPAAGRLRRRRPGRRPVLGRPGRRGRRACPASRPPRRCAPTRRCSTARRSTSPASTRPRSAASTASTGRTGSNQALGRLGTDGALVTASYADAHDLAVGGRLALQIALG